MFVVDEYEIFQSNKNIKLLHLFLATSKIIYNLEWKEVKATADTLTKASFPRGSLSSCCHVVLTFLKTDHIRLCSYGNRTASKEW
jgi:hypothetical protein